MSRVWMWHSRSPSAASRGWQPRHSPLSQSGVWWPMVRQRGAAHSGRVTITLLGVSDCGQDWLAARCAAVPAGLVVDPAADPSREAAGAVHPVEQPVSAVLEDDRREPVASLQRLYVAVDGGLRPLRPRIDRLVEHDGRQWNLFHLVSSPA